MRTRMVTGAGGICRRSGWMRVHDATGLGDGLTR